MKVGDEFDGEVRGQTSVGQGVVAHPSGRVVFIAGVWPGETGRFKVTELKGRVAQGRCLSVTKASEQRAAEPACRHHGFSQHHCGGCPWMFMDYDAQIAAKQSRVSEAIERVVGSTHAIKPIIGSENTLAYRNRVQFKSDGKRLGFVASQTHALVDITQCPILSPPNQQALSALREQLPNSNWRPKNRKQKWVTLDIDENNGADHVSVNKRLSFQQANSQQNQTMRTWLAQQLASLGREHSVLELFCGRGNFTSVISEQGFKDIMAVEGDAAAISALNAQNLNGVRAQTADLFNAAVFSELMAEHAQRSILVLDPPRDGLKQKEGLFTKRSGFDHVFYIACDLATYTRDLKAFIEAGYQLVELQTIDQFPHTPHVEIVSYLRKG